MNVLKDLTVDELRALRTHITKNDDGHTQDVVEQLVDELSKTIQDRTLNELVKPIVQEWIKERPSRRKITVAYHIDTRSNNK